MSCPLFIPLLQRLNSTELWRVYKPLSLFNYKVQIDTRRRQQFKCYMHLSYGSVFEPVIKEMVERYDIFNEWVMTPELWTVRLHAPFPFSLPELWPCYILPLGVAEANTGHCKTVLQLNRMSSSLCLETVAVLMKCPQASCCSQFEVAMTTKV